MNTTTTTLADRIIAALPEKVELTYVDYREELGPKQVQKMLEDVPGYDEAANEINEMYDDNQYDGMITVVKDACEKVANDLENGPDPDELFDELKNSDDFDAVRDAVYERDESTTIADLLRNTPSMLFRYRLVPEDSEIDGFAVPDTSYEHTDYEAEVVKLAGILGVDPVAQRENITELLDNASYGGSPQIIWYGDVEDLLNRLVPDANGDKWEIRGTLTFTNVHIGVLNGWNGSGHDVRFDGVTFTVPFDPSRIIVDEAQGKYGSWDEVCGLVKSAYKADVTFSADKVCQRCNTELIGRLCPNCDPCPED